MPKLSVKSKAQLSTCHNDLQRLFLRVVETFDCSILEGRRDKERQNLLYEAGKSQLRYPASKHNVGDDELSEAIDVAPYPINWSSRDRFILFAGFVLGTAEEMEIPIRWGGDWYNDFLINDENFQDFVHFERVRK